MSGLERVEYSRGAAGATLLRAGVVGATALSMFGANAKPSFGDNFSAGLRLPLAVRASHPLEIGVMDDRLKSASLEASEAMAQDIKSSGFDFVKVTLPITPGSIDIVNDQNGVCNATQAALDNGLGINVLMLPRFEKSMGWIPKTASERLRFKTTVAAAIARLKICAPGIKDLDITIGNEPNNKTFVREQVGAPAAYVRLLNDSYDVIKQKVAEINRTAETPLKVTVYGGELSADDNPIDFINGMAAAIKQQGITSNILDVVTFHPYPEDPEHPLNDPTKKGYVGLSQISKLDAAVSFAFGPSMPIMFTEAGVESEVPKSKELIYVGQEPPTVKVVPETVQASAYRQMLEYTGCLPDKFKGFVFFLYQDDPGRTSYQSGLKYANGESKSSMTGVVKSIRSAHEASSSNC